MSLACFRDHIILQYITKRSITPRWSDPTSDPKSVEVTFVTLPKDHCVQVPWKYIKICEYSDHFFKNLKGHWPLDDLWPHICWGYMCICYKFKLIKIRAPALGQGPKTGPWIPPSTPHLLRLHVWLYPRIIVSKSHGNTSMYVDTVINFAKYHILTCILHTVHC